VLPWSVGSSARARKGTTLDSILRDINREEEKTKKDVENFHYHYEKLRGYVYQHTKQTTIEWAKLVIDHPGAIVLIVETTQILDESGYSSGGYIEPIRFTMLSLAREEVWDYLVRPTYSKRVSGTEYHGLTMADVQEKWLLADAWSEIEELLKDKHIIIYGADWARTALRGTRYEHTLDGAYCLHNKCKEYYNEFYELSLEKVLSYQGIERRRDELKDSWDRAVMLREVIRNLANALPKQSQERFELDLPEGLPEMGEGVSNGGLGDLEDLDEHPF
jgi:hypothetical protein